MRLLMALVLALCVGQRAHAQTPPLDRPAVVRDSVSAADSIKRRRVPKRLPVTAELQRTAFIDVRARDLFLRARRARLTQDSSLVSYAAKARERTTVTAGIGSTPLRRTMYRSETVYDVAWKLGAGAQIQVTGARVGIPAASPQDEHDAVADNLTSSSITPIPYYPGNESLWLFSNRVRADVNDEDIVNPLGNGAEAYYTYAVGDSMRWQLPNGQRVFLRELTVRPRRAEWNLAVGSLWFDTQSAQLVRAAFRLATPIDMWTSIRDDSSNKDLKSKIGRMVGKALISPIEARISGVTIEYGLFDNRYWLPRSRMLDGNVQVTFAKLGFTFEQSFTYSSVNAPVTIASIPLNVPQRERAPDSLSQDEARKWRDSTFAIWQKQHTAFEDSLKKTPCDTSGYRVVGEKRRGSDIVVGVKYPCDVNKLIASSDFDKPLYDPNEAVFGQADRDALLNAALPFNAQALMRFSELPKPDFKYGLSMSRYNRVEGFSTGIGVEQQLGGGYVASAEGRMATASHEPLGELSLARTDLARTISVTGYNRLVSANDWGDPLSFGSSLSAFLFGRDEGFYYRASGGELRWNTTTATNLDWRLFAEEQRTARQRTDYSLGAPFVANVDAARGASTGMQVRWGHETGADPRGFRTLTDARVEAATGDSTYGRAAIDMTFMRGLTSNTAAAITVAGGSSVGHVPPQRFWFLGGAQTIRGQSPDTAQSGNAFWLSRGELALDERAVRYAVFGDLGWVGDRSTWRDVGRPMSGVGIGMSMMDGLVRVDVARGLYPRRQTRVSAYVNARF